VDTIERLLIVQERDTRIARLEREIKDIPARKKQEESRLKEHQDAVAKAQTELTAKRAEIKELELESVSRQEKIAKLRQQQLEIKTNKEFKAMEAEIKGVETELTKLEDQELVLMEDAETGKRVLTEKKKALQEEEEAVLTHARTLDERAAEIEVELKSLQERREAAAAEVDPQYLASYEKVHGSKHNALVALEEGVCRGCHMQVPPYVVHESKGRNSVVYCSHCGRLLY